jgi:hypothetical protein
MTTLNEMIAILKAENPNGLKIGDDLQGYTQLTDDEYNAKIEIWANARIAKETAKAEAEAAKEAAQAKLAALGLSVEDLKALGL